MSCLRYVSRCVPYTDEQYQEAVLGQSGVSIHLLIESGTNDYSSFLIE